MPVSSIQKKAQQKDPQRRPRDASGRFMAREVTREEKRILERAEARKLARYHLPTAIRIMADIMIDGGVRPDIRLDAAKALADRAEGRPRAMTVDVEGPALRIQVGGPAKKPKKQG